MTVSGVIAVATQRNERPRLVALTLAIATLTTAAVLTAMPTVRATGSCDALCTRVRDELRVFTGWLEAHGVEGYIGEVGWPQGGTPEETERWNALAERWYEDADGAGLPVTAWATGEWWEPSYDLTIYADSDDTDGVDRRNPQARILEAHPTTGAYRRGINVAGAEFDAPAIDQTSSFSNASPGTPGVDYRYGSEATFTYLASRGVEVVRIPFRWERIQPSLGDALDQAELGRLRAAAADAGAAGLQVVLDLHNYAGYYLHDGSRGVRRSLGSREVPRSAFVDVWERLSVHFDDDPHVYAYGLMNEPTGMSQVAGLSPSRRWEIISRAAVEAIRARGDTKTVMVPGYAFSGVAVWPEHHPRPWVPEDLGPVRYEAHHYWDRDNSGDYPDTYEDEVTAARSRVSNTP